jgi:hypothetical protein
MSTGHHPIESPNPPTAVSAGARGISDDTLTHGYPSCPRCGDPLTTGCRPTAGICVVDPIEDGTHLIAPGTSALTDEEYAVLGDHPHTDPGDGRTECDTCGKWIWPVIHSCKRVPVTEAAWQRHQARITAAAYGRGRDDCARRLEGQRGEGLCTCADADDDPISIKTGEPMDHHCDCAAVEAAAAVLGSASLTRHHAECVCGPRGRDDEAAGNDIPQEYR